MKIFEGELAGKRQGSLSLRLSRIFLRPECSLMILLPEVSQGLLLMLRLELVRYRRYILRYTGESLTKRDGAEPGQMVAVCHTYC
jgi:hypothetical protein